MTKLTALDGVLLLGDSILLVLYPEGDCDTIGWPLSQEQKPSLASALYDEYEMGNIKERTVLLPDGTQFNIDDNLS